VLGDQSPLRRHVTNVIVDETAADKATPPQEAIGVNADGSASTVSYEDTPSAQRTAGGSVAAQSGLDASR
jgi:hypothetical protein